ncbi:MrcB family domain-containing protein [Cytobacillus kochii]
MTKNEVGQGTAARSVWVGVRDKRISPNGFSKGVYVVALFDSTGQHLYLSIAYAVKDKTKDELSEMVKAPAKKILDVIQGDSSYDGITSGPVNLGDVKGSTAEEYEQAVIVTKHFHMLDLDEKEFLLDVNRMLDLFYDFVYEDYFKELESEIENESPKKMDPNPTNKGRKNSSGKKKKGNTHSTIDPEHYEQLLEERRKHNKRVGRMAEEFVFQKEQEKLREIGRSDLLSEVEHVAKEKDGLGYDIRSIEVKEDGSFEEIFIEAKGSSLGGNQDFSFYLTEREDIIARDNIEKYRIALVEYVGYSKQNIYDIFKPYDEKGNPQISMTPTVYKCSYRKKK